MANLTFDYHDKRAVEARIAVAIRRTVAKFLVALTVVLVIAGVGLLVSGLSVGWALVGLAAIPFIVHEWYEHHLKHLPSTKRETITGIMSGDILGQLPSSPSPRDVAVAVGQVTSGQFMGARMGLTPATLVNLSSENPEHTANLWEHAEAIRAEAGLEHISGSVLAAAIIRQVPDYESFIASVHLDDADLIAGVRWQDHLRHLIATYKTPKRTGGVARDWSFGYVPTLMKFGVNVSQEVSGGLLNVQLESHEAALDQLMGTLGTSGRQNVALIGPEGTGKSTIVRSFAERLLDASANVPSELRFRQVFSLDASSLLAAAPGRGELENLIMTILNEAYSAKNIIICLDNAQLFFEEGVGSVDMTNVLLPILDAGRLRMIVCMDEQRFLQISQRNSSLANTLNRIMVTSSTESETLQAMQERLLVTEFQRNVTYTYQSLKEALRLSERYVHDLAQPGRAIKLMESSAAYAESGLVTMNSVQQAIEKTMDIKVSVANTTEDRETLLNLEELIHRRMINQVRAVSVVSDALRRARAGVRNPNRPIGTFLFLGPTGVGKTELSKALADVYFGGEDRMIRLDLNEYVRPEDVARLIADGASDPSSLTAQAMKQPFSVVLLDEIEKAAPEVLTTLLQLLDEGILRDVNNREVSFRDTIVIATSNAGADRIREYIERGYQLEQFEQQFIDELINANYFRPEFLNRFDEIVTFTPLGKAELLQVIDLILVGVNKTLEVQKLSVTVDDDAKLLLVEKGYDPRLGARPMRRVVQRSVENTVAKQVLAGATQPGSTIHISLEQVEQALGLEQTTNMLNNSQPTPPQVG